MDVDGGMWYGRVGRQGRVARGSFASGLPDPGRTVGAIAARVAADELDPARLSGLVDIGVDEISWKKHRHYLTLVSNHATGKIVWGKAGKDAETLNAFFAEVGEKQTETIEAVSMDLGPAFACSVRDRAPHATICFDPFHVVKLATDVLDAVRRQVWQSARRLPDKTIAKKYRGARWVLLKKLDDLTTDQTGTLREIKKSCGALWRACQLKESLCVVFAGDLDTDITNTLLDRWCSKARRSRIPDFVKAARTIRKHRDGIIAAIDCGLSNGRHEGLNKTRYDSSSAEPTASTALKPPSPPSCSPADRSISSSHTTPVTHM